MKKIALSLSAIIAAALFASCGSTKNTVQISSQNVKIERVDWQGASTGSMPPAWLEAVTSGDRDAVAKSLNVDSKENKVFVISNSGSNLDFLKAWTDNVDAVSEVSGSMSRVVGQSVRANMGGTPEEIQKNVDQAVTVASSVELIGLEKRASYWVKTRRVKTGVKEAKTDADYEPAVYNYYVVYTMSNEVFQKSLESAMDRGISENTENASVLKQIITASLAKALVPDVDL